MARSQSTWNTLFLTDPEMSDGYFILDHAKTTALGGEGVKVDIMATETLPNGQTRHSLIETLDLDDSFYA